jgi:hypothetical protein
MENKCLSWQRKVENPSCAANDCGLVGAKDACVNERDRAVSNGSIYTSRSFSESSPRIASSSKNFPW